MYTAFLLAATTCLAWDGGGAYPSYGGWNYPSYGGWGYSGYGGGGYSGYGGFECGWNPYYAAAWGAWYGNPWGPMGGYGGCGCGEHECCLKRLCHRRQHRHDCCHSGGGYGDCSYGGSPYGGYGAWGGGGWGGGGWGGGGCGWGSVADAYEASGLWCPGGGCERDHCHRCCLKHLCHRHKHRNGPPPPCFLPCAGPYDGGFDWDDCSCNSGSCPGGTRSQGDSQGGTPELIAPPAAPKGETAPPPAAGPAKKS